MSQDAEKYDRLVALAGWIWTLLRNGKSTFRRSELVEIQDLDYFAGKGAGRKAFDRAKEELESFGIDIEWDESVEDSRDHNIKGAYRISGLKLRAAQQEALLGLAFTIAYRDLATEAALRIPGSFLEGAGDTLLLEANQLVAPVAEAIDDRVCVTMLYRDETEARDVQPIYLGYERGNWYLSAHEFASNRAKVFRLDRVREIAPSESTWSDRYDTEDARAAVARVRDRFFWGDGEVKRAVLAIDREAELSALRLLPGLEEIGEDESDWLVMARDYSNEENMLDAVLTLGLRAEILEPPKLRQAMIAHLSAMAGERP